MTVLVKSTRIGWLWGGAGALLLVPLVAMRITDEVRWSAVDFAAMAALLAGVCIAWQWLSRASANGTYRAGAGVALVAVLLLVWINGAVGLIGSENNPANWMYAGVIAILVGGAALARLRAAGMARALRATAVAQVAAGAIALATGMGSNGAAWPGDVIALSMFFAGAWLASAWLFARADRSRG